MTCVIGYKDKDRIYLGADTLGNNGHKKGTIINSKVFFLQDSEIMIGFVGSIRGLNIITHSSNLIDERISITEERIVNEFIPNLISLLNRGGFCKESNNIKSHYNILLIAYKDRLWQIDSSFGLIEWTDDCCAIGSGSDYAYGSLFTTKNMNELSIEEKIIKGLEAAAKYDLCVDTPFKIINNLDNNKN